MFKIVFLWVKNIFRSTVRKLYWLYRLSRAKIGKKVKFEFPVRVEGKGKLVIGDGCQIGKNVYFGVGGQIILGKNCRIDNDVQIITGRGAKIIFGNNCWIMQGTVIRARENTFELGNDVVISTNVQIFSREQGYEGYLKVGSGSHINDYAMLDVTGDLIIGEKVAFGQYSIAFTHDHIYSDSSTPAWQGGVKTGKVEIKKWAWVGAKVVVLPNVTIGYRSVIASGAVVSKNCESETIYAGIPAKEIKKINKNEN